MIESGRRGVLRTVAEQWGTPVFVYDAAVIRAQLRSLHRFDVIRYAQKACSNLSILRLLREQGVRVDCVSEGELRRALEAGFMAGRQPAEIVYTADLLGATALERVVEGGVPVNAGSIDMLTQVGQRCPKHPVWLRINPGFGHGHSKKVNTGGESSKHGIWHEDLPLALEQIDRYDLTVVGLHMHIGSGADFEHLSRVCDAMVTQAQRMQRDFQAISAGGGLPIPYRAGEAPLDIDEYFRRWDAARAAIEAHLGHSIELELEPGRYLVGPAGVLVCEVRATKRMGSNHFTLVDAGFNDLVRPAMYGAYHEIDLLPRVERSDTPAVRPTVVAGPLCESGDLFTLNADGEVQARDLAPAHVGDLLVFHDAGAYGASMGSNYNSRPLPAEVLVDGTQVRLIRRRQTMDDILQLERDL